MGQRSQIYVAYDGKIVARYYGWMYGERMVSRARHTIEWIKNRKSWSEDKYNITTPELIRILDTNFDIKDVVISEDISGLPNKDMFTEVDNNDGKLFIQIDGLEIKYCFSDRYARKIFTGDQYMRFDTESCYDKYKWDNEEYQKSAKMKLCARNIKWIEKNAKLMTQEEFNEFKNKNYETECPF